MKQRPRVVLFGIVVVGLAAISALKHETGVTNGGRNGGPCCPLVAALDVKQTAIAANPATTNTTPLPVIAYYFHGTVRCETCLMIEQQAKAVMEQQFGAEMAAGRLSFVSINYEEAEHRHFLTDYKLPCPSLVLARPNEGKEGKWKLLGDTWLLVQEPVRLTSYVETEVRYFLNGQNPNTNSVGQGDISER